jgi:hypothetical protein
MRAATAALAAGLLAACSAQPMRIPPDIPLAGAAVVRAWSPAENELRVLAIDGVDVPKGTTHVYLRPGEHRVTTRWSNSKGVAREGQVRAVLAGGSTYVLEAEPDGALRTVRFGLVDKGPNYDEECLTPTFFGNTVKGKPC